jgi:hypothetical protein
MIGYLPGLATMLQSSTFPNRKTSRSNITFQIEEQAMHDFAHLLQCAVT